MRGLVKVMDQARIDAMTIWQYPSISNGDHWEAFNVSTCKYCKTATIRSFDAEHDAQRGWRRSTVGPNNNYDCLAQIAVCPICGWWNFAAVCALAGSSHGDVGCAREAILKRFDIARSDTPIADTRAYLIARFGERFNVNPRLLEEVVASVFRDHGYKAEVTAYSGDGGIDVVLRDTDGKSIGVQVKRHGNSVQVSYIRELMGALVLGGHTKGIFVTTSKFQSGATKVAAASASRGYPIELIDAERFFDALKIAKLNVVGDIFEQKPWYGEE